MKNNKNVRVAYHETQEGPHRTLNIKISTLNDQHRDILREFKSENGHPKPEGTVHLKLEDLLK